MEPFSALATGQSCSIGSGCEEESETSAPCMSLISLLLASLLSAACRTLLLESTLSRSIEPMGSASADKLSSTLSSLEVVVLTALVEVVVVVIVSTGEEDVAVAVVSVGEEDGLVSAVSGKLVEGAETSEDDVDASEDVAGTVSASLGAR